MKKSLVLLPLLFLTLTSCGGNEVNRPNPESIKITNLSGSEQLVVGDTLELFSTVLPQEAMQTVTWESSDSTKATVTNGLVSAIAVGQVEIHVTSSAKTSIKNYVRLQIVDSLNLPTDVQISAEGGKTTIEENETLQLSALVLPDEATYHRIRWTSGDNEIATVGSFGLVTGRKSGTTSITASAMNQAEQVLASGSFSLTVNESAWKIDTISKVYNEKTRVNDKIDVIGKVMVSNNNGIVVADNNDAVLAYQPAYIGAPAVVGDIVNLKGTIGVFNTSAQISSGTIEVLSENVPTITGPAIFENFGETDLINYMSGVSEDDIMKKMLVKPIYVDVKGLTAVVASNGFIDLYLNNGAGRVNLSIKGSTFRDFLKGGDKVDFQGYITGIEKSLENAFPRVAVYAIEGSQKITPAN